MAVRDTADARLTQAIESYNRRAFDDAARAFAALENEPALADDARYGLGLVALERGADADAAGWLARVGAGSHRHADAQYYLARIEARGGQRDAALLRCRRVLERQPAHAAARRLCDELAAPAPAPAPAPARAAARPPSERPETEFVLPTDDAGLERYAERRRAKARVDFAIENWTGLPPAVRAARVGLGVVVGAIFVTVLAGFAAFAVFAWPLLRAAMPLFGGSA